MLPHSLTVVPIFWSYPRAATQLEVDCADLDTSLPMILFEGQRLGGLLITVHLDSIPNLFTKGQPEG